jgi:hypothetical protein
MATPDAALKRFTGHSYGDGAHLLLEALHSQTILGAHHCGMFAAPRSSPCDERVTCSS